MKKSQAEYLTLRTENNYGVVSDIICASQQEALSYVKQSIQQIAKGDIQNLHICKEIPKYKFDSSNLQVEEDVIQNPNATEYELQLLREQILLFDRQQDMTNFIETEKCLAQNCVQQLTNLSLSLMKLCQQLLVKKKPFCDISFKQDTFSREKLDKIESECLNTLIRVREERKRIESCCVCLYNVSNMIIFPCMHMVLCKGCAEPVKRCPICMGPIREIRQFFK